MRITLDSNILVRAVISSQGPALRLLDMLLDVHTLVLSRFILDEVERVLLYPRIQFRYRITADEAIRFTGNLARPPTWLSQLFSHRLPRPIQTTMRSSTRGRWQGGDSMHTKYQPFFLSRR